MNLATSYEQWRSIENGITAGGRKLRHVIEVHPDNNAAPGPNLFCRSIHVRLVSNLCTLRPHVNPPTSVYYYYKTCIFIYCAGIVVLRHISNQQNWQTFASPLLLKIVEPMAVDLHKLRMVPYVSHLHQISKEEQDVTTSEPGGIAR